MAATHLVAEDDGRADHLSELVRLLAEADVRRADDEVGDLLATEVIDQHGHRIQVVDGDLEESLDLRAVQVQGQDPVGAGRFDAIGADPRPDRHPGFVLLVSLGVGEERDHRRHLGGAGPFERVDPEQQFHEIVVDRVLGPLDHVDVAASDVFEHADEDVALAERLRLRLRKVDSQLAADRLPQRPAGAPREYLQLAVGVDPVRGRADQRLVLAHDGRPVARVGRGRNIVRRVVDLQSAHPH